MLFNVEVKISLKNGMLNPEATTIERSLDLLGYDVNNAKTIDIITFEMDGENESEINKNVEDMCERLLCNPVIHNYDIKITPSD